MEPLYDLTKAAKMEPYVYKLRQEIYSLFPVPRDNAVGTNSLNNAITLFSFKKDSLKTDEYFRNAYDGSDNGKVYTANHRHGIYDR